MMQKHIHRSIIGLFGQKVLVCIYLFLMFGSLPYTVAQSSNQPSTYNSNASTINITYSGITIIFIFACFLLFFIVACFYGCSDTGSDLSISFRSEENGISRRGNRGLDPILIETFPTFAYSYVRGHKLGKGALECAVCLTEFQDKDTIRLLPKCDHVFHPVCIDAWLSKHTTCPVCRANLFFVPGEAAETLESRQDTSEEPPLAVEVAVSPEQVITQMSQNKPSRYAGRFSRSNSTGHSLVQPGENVERFTLRLPDHVRKQILSMRQVKRTKSMEAFPVLMSPKKDYRMTGESSDRGGRLEGLVFSRVPPFFMRSSSPR